MNMVKEIRGRERDMEKKERKRESVCVRVRERESILGVDDKKVFLSTQKCQVFCFLILAVFLDRPNDNSQHN